MNTKQKGKKDGSKERSGADIMLDNLYDVGVRHVFFHTGGRVIPVNTAITRRIGAAVSSLEARSIKVNPRDAGSMARLSAEARTPLPIRFVHEPAAGHAAAGYFKASGKTAAVLITSGPGATNIVTPIADAYYDSVSTLYITGQVPLPLIATDPFQYVPITILTMPITKQNFLVTDIDDLGSIVRQAYYLATTGRKRPTLIDIPSNIQLGRSSNGHHFSELRGYTPDVSLDESVAKRVLEMLALSDKPVIYAGGGVNDFKESALLRNFAETQSIPIVNTFTGIGSIPLSHSLALGMSGMHGTYAANHAMLESDLIIAVGARFTDRGFIPGVGENAKHIIHVDVDNSEIKKVIRSSFGVNAYAHDFLSFAVENALSEVPDRSGWVSQVASWKSVLPEYDEDPRILTAKRVISSISDYTKGEATVITDVGQHQMATAHHYNFSRPRQLISSSAFGTMGFGLPAGIGAYFANPDSRYVLITGDGSLKMNIQELETLVRNEIPLKIFVMNNSRLGMVTQWEDMFFGGYNNETCEARSLDCTPGCNGLDGTYCRDGVVNFAAMSGYVKGLQTAVLKKPELLEACLERVFSDNKPWLIDVWTNSKEIILPIVPPGKGINDMVMKQSR